MGRQGPLRNQERDESSAPREHLHSYAQACYDIRQTLDGVVFSYVYQEEVRQ